MSEEEIKQAFDNNYDCRGMDESNLSPAMSKGKFVEVVKSLLTNISTPIK